MPRTLSVSSSWSNWFASQVKGARQISTFAPHLECLENRIALSLTSLVKDINPVGDHSNPSLLVNVNQTLFFTADDGIHGEELWKSDGTSAGTLLVKDIHSTAGMGGSISELTNVNGTLFFLTVTDFGAASEKGLKARTFRLCSGIAPTARSTQMFGQGNQNTCFLGV